MSQKLLIITFATLMVLSLAAKGDYKQSPLPYSFSYNVNDKDYNGPKFGQNEQSDGRQVSGGYEVVLPDGRIQKVNYVADHENGFIAQVSYEGKAKYPSKFDVPFVVKRSNKYN